MSVGVTGIASCRQMGFVATLVIAGLLAAGCGAGAKAPASSANTYGTSTPAPAHLTYAMINYSWTTVPHLVAQAKGFFAQQNLTVDYVVAGQSSAACQ